jgi:hypothetical protein
MPGCFPVSSTTQHNGVGILCDYLDGAVLEGVCPLLTNSITCSHVQVQCFPTVHVQKSLVLTPLRLNWLPIQSRQSCLPTQSSPLPLYILQKCGRE